MRKNISTRCIFYKKHPNIYIFISWKYPESRNSTFLCQTNIIPPLFMHSCEDLWFRKSKINYSSKRLKKVFIWDSSCTYTSMKTFNLKENTSFISCIVWRWLCFFLSKISRITYDKGSMETKSNLTNLDKVLSWVVQWYIFRFYALPWLK